MASENENAETVSRPVRAAARGRLGEIFGGYEVEAELGRGGMGVVYRARQSQLNRAVALKMLSGYFDATDLQRFLREAETAAGLRHANIVHIYEVGEHEGTPFFSMEFVEGGTLGDRLRTTPPEPRAAAELLWTVARAVHFAHGLGVVHRDLKPGNILLDPEGVPKVADFGIAKQLHRDVQLTRKGDIVGTPSYMAPEQARGGETGAAADVYSLGAILYEMLAGRPPFVAEESETAITMRVLLEEPVSPAWHRPEIPRDLEIICMKCLRKEARDRYASAAALAADLRAHLDGEGIQARPPTRIGRAVKWVRRHPWRLAFMSWAALVLVAGVERWWQWDARERIFVQYTTALDTVAGRIEPVAVLSAREAERRPYSYRLTRRGRHGPVSRVEALNARGYPLTARQSLGFDALTNWLSGMAGMQPFEERDREATEMDFDLVNGEVSASAGFDRNHFLIWRVVNDRPTGGSAAVRHVRFTDANGFSMPLVQTAAQAEVRSDAAGHAEHVLFYSDDGQPAINGEGVYGYAIERDAAGRVRRLLNLGRDGQCAPNRRGVSGLALGYDSRGRNTRLTYLDDDGHPQKFQGVVTIESAFDDNDRLTRQRFLDAAGQPVNNTQGIAEMDYDHNDRGEITASVQQRMNGGGRLEAISTRRVRYDDHGFVADVQLDAGAQTTHERFLYDGVGNQVEERWLDPTDQPVTGSFGWATKRSLHQLLTNPPRWRQEDAYFDAGGKDLFLADGYHRLIQEINQAGNVCLLMQEFDPAKAGYFRYVSRPEYDAHRRRKRRTVRYENADGQLASGGGLRYTQAETLYDDNGRELTEWQEGCVLASRGAPTWQIDRQWSDLGMLRRVVRQACDAKRKPLELTANGTAARTEESYNELGRLRRINESGFNEKTLGYSAREAVFTDAACEEVVHRRADGSKVERIDVVVVEVSADAQARSRESLRPGDRLRSANGRALTSAYEWAYNDFEGGNIEIERDGQTLQIDGFEPGKLGVALEDRAAK